MTSLQTVADIMSTPTYFVPGSAPLEEADETMQEHRVSALAVTDDAGELAGVISRTDLIHRALEVKEQSGVRTLVLPEVRTRDVMTPTPIRVNANAQLTAAAAIMAKRGVHRVFVEDEGQLAGVVATREVMVAVARSAILVPLGECMTTEVVSVQRTTSIRVAMERIADCHKHGIVVKDRAAPVGIVTLEELLLAQHWPATFAVEEFMYRRPLCLPASMPVNRATEFALANDVRHIVVIDDDGVRGLVTGIDLARVYAWSHETGG